MGVHALRCPSCGTTIQPNDGHQFFTCPSCGSILERDYDVFRIVQEIRYVHETKRTKETKHVNITKHIQETKQTHEIRNVQETRHINEAEVIKQQVELEKEKNKGKEEKNNKWIIAICIAIMIVPVFYIGSRVITHNSKMKELEKLSIEIQQDILDNHFDEAYTKTVRLRLDDDYSSHDTKQWEEHRKELQKLIKEKQKESQKTCSHEWIQTGNERDSGILFWKAHQKEYKCSKCGMIDWKDDK